MLRKYFPNAFSAKKDNSKETNVFKKYLPKIFKKNEGNSSSENNFKLEELSRATLLNWAGDEEKAVFLGLSKILKLNDEIPGIEIKSLQENLKKERQAIEKKKKELSVIKSNEEQVQALMDKMQAEKAKKLEEEREKALLELQALLKNHAAACANYKVIHFIEMSFISLSVFRICILTRMR